jgi:putative ABC transport system permease protein
MMIAERDSASNLRLASYPTFQDWRAGTDAFEALAFVRGEGAVLASPEGAERLLGAFVTDEFFRVMPEPAAVGRTLEPFDFAPDAPSVAAISWSLWQRRFGGDRSVIGRNVTLGERSYTIVGVMPIGFTYPAWPADLWAPITPILSTNPALKQRGVHTDSRIVGRLRAGVDSAAGERALSAVAAHLAETYPAENGGWRSVSFTPVASELLGGSSSQLGMLTAAAVFVLLIACVNVAALTMARAGARSRELAIRTALGGGRGTMLRLLAAECVVLGVAAGSIGLAVAAFVVSWLRIGARDLLPRAAELAVDPWAMAAAVALSIVLVVVMGLLPALHSGSLVGALREGKGGGAGPARRRVRAVLVVGEIALALVLLTGAGLLLRSLERLQRVPTGFDQDRLLAVPINPPSAKYESPERALQLYRDVARAVAAVPGVRSVALTNHVPLSGASMTTPVEVDGAPARETDQALFRVVDTAYFRTTGIPVVRGRDFTADEVNHPGDAVLVNQALRRPLLARC